MKFATVLCVSAAYKMISISCYFPFHIHIFFSACMHLMPECEVVSEVTKSANFKTKED